MLANDYVLIIRCHCLSIGLAALIELVISDQVDLSLEQTHPTGGRLTNCSTIFRKIFIGARARPI